MVSIDILYALSTYRIFISNYEVEISLENYKRYIIFAFDLCDYIKAYVVVYLFNYYLKKHLK